MLLTRCILGRSSYNDESSDVALFSAGIKETHENDNGKENAGDSRWLTTRKRKRHVATGCHLLHVYNNSSRPKKIAQEASGGEQHGNGCSCEYSSKLSQIVLVKLLVVVTVFHRRRQR